jgi:WD40 repeat protein
MNAGALIALLACQASAGQIDRALIAKDQEIGRMAFSIARDRIFVQPAKLPDSEKISAWPVEGSKEPIWTADIARGARLVAVTPDDKLVLLRRGKAQGQVTVEFFDVESKKLERTVSFSDIPVVTRILAVAPDCSWLCLCEVGSMQALALNLQNNGKTLRLGHIDIVRAATFSPDGSSLVTLARVPFVWNLATGKAIAVPHPHEESSAGPLFSPDGRFLAIANSDASIGLYDTNRYQRQGGFSTTKGDLLDPGCIGFLNGGKLLYIAEHDRLRFFDTQKRQLLEKRTIALRRQEAWEIAETLVNASERHIALRMSGSKGVDIYRLPPHADDR